MLAKFLTNFFNLGLAVVLVLLSVANSGFAQDTAAGESVRLSIPLRGTAIIQEVGSLTLTPAVFNPGAVIVGQNATATVTLANEAGAQAEPVSISAVTLFGMDAQEFSIDYAGFTTLQPGQSLTINMNFTPLSAGEKNAGVRLEIEGASAPHVIMARAEAVLPLSSKLLSDKNTVDFGEVFTSNNATQKMVLSNSSTKANAPAIFIQSLTLSGQTADAFSHDFTPTSLAAGESLTVNIQMQTAQEGFKSAQLTIEHDGVNPALSIPLEGEVVEPTAIPVNFGTSTLGGANINKGTSIQFGPDGKLYVSQMDGKILVFNVQRNGKNNYNATLLQTISVIHNMPNRNDMGVPQGNINGRLVTGFLVTGSAATPVIYVQSNDPRQGAGPSGADKNLDTNSGILHRLTKNGNNWAKVDLVRGLPRSEENHVGNGMVMLGNKLLAMQGGHTNMGGPSNNFAKITEYALSSALLEFDLAALGNGTYDLPTLDDEDRAGVNDQYDPFGGNNGKNQAILEANGPVEIYAPGFRNAYDVVLTAGGKLYSVDNGPNAGWGGEPIGNCSNAISEQGATHRDGLHLISNKGYYAGHPNPTRGNKNNTFNASNPQTPIQGGANPLECNYKEPVAQDGALTIFNTSTNGIDEYTASNFGNAMKGDLVTVSFGKQLWRVQLNAAGNKVTSKSVLKNNFGKVPLDITTQNDNEIFPGTIWVVDHAENGITVLEPADY